MAAIKMTPRISATLIGLALFSWTASAVAAPAAKPGKAVKGKVTAGKAGKSSKSKAAAFNYKMPPPVLPAAPEPVAPAVVAPVVAAAPPVAPPVKVEPPKPVEKAAEPDKSALAKKEGDVDSQKLLKEVLESTDKSYTLLKRGKYEVNYDVNYSYYSDDQLLYRSNSQGTALDLLGVDTDSQHIISNTISGEYGLRDNVTLGVSVPMVTKIDAQGTEGRKTMNGIGDVSTSMRWQPYGIRAGWPSVTVSGSLRLPTGISPYEISVGKEMSTGSGTFGLTGGVNLSKVIDPVVLFSSANYSYTLPKKGLNQLQSNGKQLVKVEPASAIGFALGLGFSMAYEISMNASLSSSFSGQSKFHFSDGSVGKSSPSTSASLNFGIGWRISNKFSLNISNSFGLTRGSPDFSLGVSMPVNF